MHDLMQLVRPRLESILHERGANSGRELKRALELESAANDLKVEAEGGRQRVGFFKSKGRGSDGVRGEQEGGETSEEERERLEDRGAEEGAEEVDVVQSRLKFAVEVIEREVSGKLERNSQRITKRVKLTELPCLRLPWSDRPLALLCP